ncbi:hypothetical protein A8924_7030 [Saccharopolyspora erythraea NRRL 2338]|uniref:Uncharacterized protein n=2 Tax=Saccharopolyspora erythraea TaxID=1836 RepID=A4FP68_SACEN|nr:hypothetical protein [Saccharopolyspora erythraea]EQD84785.1 hypothetical protein N599_18280 [Saccharopolyspora erythraea D]PFG99485.1 hypothetical protein A8924_7030 [Saccharopolyspora erythraea NRRL 2338]QRK89389.1 hypothetical protein JQX30_33415 [Saccharopolyspora erythraea]CAM05843.1 hypothetical protein SACE_6677 [Saccharopolyspora erythraea NRRL 2338]
MGLGERLRQAGHEVVIATQEAFAPLVAERGLEFRLMPGDIRSALESERGRPGGRD